MLNDYLFDLNRAPRDKWTSAETRDILNYLADTFGITIVKASRQSSRRPVKVWSAPNWEAIYDSMIEHVFETTDGARIYWPVYDWDTGKIVADKNDPANAGLFINEPPPYKYFINTQTDEYQGSRPNVRVEDDADGRKWFKVTRPIRQGDEILLCYGPLYNRSIADDGDYEINYDVKEGCGNPAELKAHYSRDRSGDWAILNTNQSVKDLTKLVDYLDKMRKFKYVGETFGEEEDESDADADSSEIRGGIPIIEEKEAVVMPIRKRARPAVPFKKQAFPVSFPDDVSFSDVVVELIPYEETSSSSVGADDDDVSPISSVGDMDFLSLESLDFLDDIHGPWWTANMEQIEKNLNALEYQNAHLISNFSDQVRDALNNRPDGSEIVLPHIIKMVKSIVGKAIETGDLARAAQFYRGPPQYWIRRENLAAEFVPMLKRAWVVLKTAPNVEKLTGMTKGLLNTYVYGQYPKVDLNKLKQRSEEVINWIKNYLEQQVDEEKRGEEIADDEFAGAFLDVLYKTYHLENESPAETWVKISNLRHVKEDIKSTLEALNLEDAKFPTLRRIWIRK